MRYGSVCSGIEAATAAWHHMGWEPAFFSEIEKFPRAVLEHHYPEVPLHGDFTTIEQNQYGKIDLLVGGTPCQSFSIAGLRGGLDDDRGNLALEFCRLAQREQPRWIVWENVPGVLSSSGGRDFGSILGALEDLGYGLAYRVLDAQYFGVAQRRRRVFVVGYLGDWRPAAAVLFERSSMSGHPAPSREARKEAARAAAGGTYSCGGTGEYRSSSSSSPLLRTGADYGHGGEVLVVGGGRVGSCVDVAPTLNAGGNRTGGDRPYGTSVDTCDSLCVAVVGALACNTGPKGHDAGNFACNQAADEGRVVPVVISEGVDLYNGSITDQVAATFNASSGDANHSGPKVMHTASCIAFPAEMSATQSATTEELAPALSVKHTTAVASCLAFDTTQISSPHNYSNPKPGDPCHPLAAGAHPPAVVYGMTTEQTPKFAEDLALTLTKQSPTGGGQPQAVAYSITPMNSGKDYKARETDVAQPVMAAGPVGGNQGGDFVLSHAIQAGALRTNPSSGPNGVGVQADLAYTLEARSEVQAVAFQPRIGRNGRGYSETVFPALNGADAGATSDMRPCVANAATSAVRRLTPVECERLQGFPDGFTAIPWGKKSADECPDGPRYKVLGNSMAVPVMRWIGERIQLVDDFVSLF